MTGKMMMRKSGLALLGLVIGMAFMGASSVPTSAGHGDGHGGHGKGKKCQSKADCEGCCANKPTPEKKQSCIDKCRKKAANPGQMPPR